MKTPFILYEEQFEKFKEDCKKEGLDLCYKFVYPLEFSWRISITDKLLEKIVEKSKDFSVVKYEKFREFGIPKYRFTFYGVSDAQQERLLDYLENNRHIYKTLNIHQSE